MANSWKSDSNFEMQQKKNKNERKGDNKKKATIIKREKKSINSA